ncbi:MAG: hypothetical protein PHW34_08900 [Hespellia sp.]|nr:hypothetical protein [Hespellia sp.]
MPLNLFQMKEASAVFVRHMALFVLVLLMILFAFVLILWGRIKEITIKAYTDVTGINNKNCQEKCIANVV